MNLTAAPFYAIAFFATLAMAIVSFWIVLKVDPLGGKFHTTTWFCWLFFALCASAFISVLLNASQVDVSGQVFGLAIKLVGPVAVFFLIWYIGLQQATKVNEQDRLLDIKLADKDKHLADTIAEKDKLIYSKEADNAELKEKIDLLSSRVKSRDAEISVMQNKPVPLLTGTTYTYRLKTKSQKQIVLITGKIEEIDKVDVLVNSENTHMFMSRPLENSVSGILRYHGATKRNNQIVEKGDVIADALAKKLEDAKCTVPVPAASVFGTPAGELSKNGVRWIFHVASVEGTPGYGFRPVANISECVSNVLKEASKPEYKVKRIVFPLMGTGQARGDMEDITGRLFDAAIQFLEKTSDSPITSVYFSALTQHHLDTYKKVIGTREVTLQT